MIFNKKIALQLILRCSVNVPKQPNQVKFLFTFWDEDFSMILEYNEKSKTLIQIEMQGTECLGEKFLAHINYECKEKLEEFFQLHILDPLGFYDDHVPAKQTN